MDGRDRGNSRNSGYKKTIKGDFGNLEASIPRDRNSTFDPVILPKGETQFTGFGDKIISMYARGMTTRDIQRHLEEIYGVGVSPSLISQGTDGVSAEMAEKILKTFAAKWDTSHPSIARSWRNNGERIILLFSYPAEIRKAICTTNAIESLNMSLRKVTRNRGHFPSDDAMFKLLYLALKNIAKKWTMPIRDWKSALNQFSIRFEGRLPHR